MNLVSITFSKQKFQTFSEQKFQKLPSCPGKLAHLIGMIQFQINDSAAFPALQYAFAWVAAGP